MHKVKLIRITTVPQSLGKLLQGQLKFMTKNGYEVIGVSSSGSILNEVEENEGIKTVAIEMTRTMTPFKDLKAVWQLYKLLKKEHPTIVHTHTPKAGTVGMLAAKLAGIPHRLHTVAGLPLLVTQGKKRKLLNFVEKQTYGWATKVYPNSIGLKKIILENKYTTKNKLKIIGNGSSNGIDTEYFNPQLVPQETKDNIRNGLKIKKNDFVFLFVGRLVSDKGINELVTAFDILSKQYKDIHLVLVGKYENDLDPLLEDTISSIQNNTHIHAVGYKTNVLDYYAMANVLTFPSYREGFPNVVMQAAAMQLSTIATDINGCNEIISHGNNGWIIPVKSMEGLKERMEWSYKNQEESKKMGLKSRELMQRKFERKEFWKLLLNEYNSLIKD